MSCPYKPFCTYLTSKMKRLGIHANSIDENCVGDAICDTVHENTRVLTQHVDATNAGVIAEFVKELFQDNIPIDRSESTLDRMLHSASFHCPEMHIDIYQPCTVKSCSFWTPNSWTRNCILCYRIDQSKDMLDVKELAFLMNKSVSEVRTETGKSIAEARVCALAARLEKDEKEIPASPEKEQPEPAEHTSEIEIIKTNFRLSPRRVLKIACDTFATIKSASQALNLSPDKFKALCDRFELSTAHLN